MRKPTTALVLALSTALFACAPAVSTGDGGADSSDRTDSSTSSDATVADRESSDGGSSVIDGSTNDGTSGIDAGVDSASDARGADSAVDAGRFRSSTRQSARMLGYRGSPNGFYEYLPPEYDGAGTLPLLVFWHGIGENGNGTTELDRVLVNGPPRLINRDQWPATRPFIVLSAQHAGSGCPTSNEIRAFITWALANYRVDAARVYLTGLSCGAIGSWNYLGDNTDTQVVAAVLVAGDGRSAWSRQMCMLGRVAIWGFHGDADTTVSPDGTRVPMTSLIACPSPPRRDARLTMYPGVGHDSWSRTYDLSAGHDIYAWLLAQHR